MRGRTPAHHDTQFGCHCTLLALDQEQQEGYKPRPVPPCSLLPAGTHTHPSHTHTHTHTHTHSPLSEYGESGHFEGRLLAQHCTHSQHPQQTRTAREQTQNNTSLLAGTVEILNNLEPFFLYMHGIVYSYNTRVIITDWPHPPTTPTSSWSRCVSPPPHAVPPPSQSQSWWPAGRGEPPAETGRDSGRSAGPPRVSGRPEQQDSCSPAAPSGRPLAPRETAAGVPPINASGRGRSLRPLHLETERGGERERGRERGMKFKFVPIRTISLADLW